MLEETGLCALTLHMIDMVYSFPVEDRWRYLYAPGVQTIVEHVFLARVPDDAEPRLSEEHIDLRWCFFAEASALLDQPERPEFVEAIKRCNRFLRASMTLEE